MRPTHLLEHEDLCANLPESQPPASKDILHVIPHAVDEKEIPSLEALLEDGHLAEATTSPAAREEDSAGGLGLDKDA